MKNLKYIILLLPIIMLSACGGNSNEDDNIDINKNPLGALMKMSENMEKQAKDMDKKMKNKKDAKAINYADLIKYLPTSIDGYELNGEATGSSIDMSGLSYSSAEVKFKNDKSSIHITLLDYNAAISMYAMSTAMWSTGLKIDTPNELAQSVTLDDNISGWETIKKKSNEVSLFLGIGNRFLLTLEGTNQKNTNILKDVAKSMDLDGLKSLD